MKIFFGSDHRGFALKQELLKRFASSNYEIQDLGPDKLNHSDDYVDFAIKVGEAVAREEGARGLLLCNSGIGMEMAANKIDRIRAAEVENAEEARQDRIEHDSNVLVLAAEKIDSVDTAMEVIKVWLETEFAGGRHLRRINKMRWQEIVQEEDLDYRPRVVPSVLTASKADALAQLQGNAQFSPLLNIDLVDDDLVQGNTITGEELLDVVGEIESLDKFVVIHLMHRQPQKLMMELNNMRNVLLVLIHAEADIAGLVDKEWSFQLGVTLNPNTKVDIELIKQFEHLQLMTVNPGQQGSEFKPEVLSKIQEVRQSGFAGQIHIDGAVKLHTLPEIMQYRVGFVYPGSAISQSSDPEAMYQKLVDYVRLNQ